MMPNPLSDKPNYKRHDDDEWWDEIRIRVVPRYKTSGLSGDEWRISAVVEIFRKGVLLKDRWFSKLHYAADFLPAMLHELSDEGCPNYKDFEKFCAQPGCAEEGVVEYRIIDQFYQPYGDKMPKRDYLGEYHRRFCEKHAQRGDCGLEDADRNYVLISAPPGWEGNADLGAQEAASPSVGPVFMDGGSLSPDSIKQAMDQMLKERNEDKGTPGSGT